MMSTHVPATELFVVLPQRPLRAHPAKLACRATRGSLAAYLTCALQVANRVRSLVYDWLMAHCSWLSLFYIR